MIRQYISESYQPDIQQCNMEARDKDKKKKIRFNMWIGSEIQIDCQCTATPSRQCVTTRTC